MRRGISLIIRGLRDDSTTLAYEGMAAFPGFGLEGGVSGARAGVVCTTGPGTFGADDGAEEEAEAEAEDDVDDEEDSVDEEPPSGSVEIWTAGKGSTAAAGSSSDSGTDILE